MSTTDKRNDPRLPPHQGPDTEPVEQDEVYLILSEAERAKGFVRPYRNSYIHTICGSKTTMARSIAETYARNPHFYGFTYCCVCKMHRPVGPDGEFVWEPDGPKVGT